MTIGVGTTTGLVSSRVVVSHMVTFSSSVSTRSTNSVCGSEKLSTRTPRSAKSSKCANNETGTATDYRSYVRLRSTRPNDETIEISLITLSRCDLSGDAQERHSRKPHPRRLPRSVIASPYRRAARNHLPTTGRKPEQVDTRPAVHVDENRHVNRPESESQSGCERPAG